MAKRWTLCRIETERLLLRRWDPADARAVLAIIDGSEAHLGAWLPWLQHRPRTVTEQARLLRTFRSNFDLGKEFVFGVFAKTGQCLGSLGLHRSVGPCALEIGYWLDQTQCGRGLGTEMVSGACQAAFSSPGIQRLEIHCAPENVPSSRIAARLGFTHEATLAGRLTSARGIHDRMIWSLWRDAAKPALRAARATGFDALGQQVFPLDREAQNSG